MVLLLHIIILLHGTIDSPMARRRFPDVEEFYQQCDPGFFSNQLDLIFGIWKDVSGNVRYCRKFKDHIAPTFEYVLSSIYVNYKSCKIAFYFFVIFYNSCMVLSGEGGESKKATDSNGPTMISNKETSVLRKCQSISATEITRKELQKGVWLCLSDCFKPTRERGNNAYNIDRCIQCKTSISLVLHIEIVEKQVVVGVQTSQATRELLGIGSIKVRLETDFKRARAELELNIKLVY
uniref:Uncharacterized protein n=1 Tax=Lactuca sativa TaxID=4236 RepID=A0A9R1WAM7_LACSA|nr:hypothetical protein LSAT_V11C300132500 [Lactuca sativa]